MDDLEEAGIIRARGTGGLYSTKYRRRPFSEVYSEMLFEGDFSIIAYVLGVLHGDGYIYKPQRRLMLDVKDRRFALKFAKALKKIGLFPRWFEKSRWGIRENHVWITYHYMVTATCDQELIDFIALLPLMWKKKEKFAYLEGLYDSEGSYYEERDTIKFTNKSPILLERVESLLRELGMQPHTYPYQKCGEIYVMKKDMLTFKSNIKTFKVM